MAKTLSSAKIKNTSSQILMIRLNSGKTIHLAPKEESGPINKIELVNNPVIKKLESRNWISAVEKKAARPESKPKPKKKPRLKLKKVKVKKEEEKDKE
jgi:hypothetical protein